MFTPGGEVPLAGHPNIGTAFILATTGHLGKINGSTFGRVLRSNITDVISFDVKALLDPVPLPDGDIKVGLLGTEAMTRDLQRWGKPFDIEAVPRWLSMLEDPNDLRQLEAFSWLGNTAYWLAGANSSIDPGLIKKVHCDARKLGGKILIGCKYYLGCLLPRNNFVIRIW